MRHELDSPCLAGFLVCGPEISFVALQSSDQRPRPAERNGGGFSHEDHFSYIVLLLAVRR